MGKEEGLEAKIARVDETTINLRDDFKEFKDDFKKFVTTNDERHGTHSKRLRVLEDDKTFRRGAVWVLGALWALLGGIFARHILSGVDRMSAPSAAAAEVHEHAR